MLATGKRCEFCRQILIRDELDLCDDCVYEFEKAEFIGVEDSQVFIEEVLKN